MAERCGNPDHPERKAVVRLSFPDSHYVDTTACRSCLRMHISAYVLDESVTILVTPIKAAP